MNNPPYHGEWVEYRTYIGENPEMTFSEAGHYCVALAVRDDDDLWSEKWPNVMSEPPIGSTYSYFHVYACKVDEIGKWDEGTGDIDSSTLYVPVGGEIDVYASSIPTEGYQDVYFPEGQPIWTITGPGDADIFPSTYYSAGQGNGDDKAKVEGFTEPGAYTLHAQCGDYDPGDDITIIAYGIESVEWETYGTNEPIEPPLADPSKPYKIFPGKKSYDDNGDESTKRNWVKVVVNLTAPVEDASIYLRAFDVDDPAIDAPVDRFNHVVGDTTYQIGPDNFGSGAYFIFDEDEGFYGNQPFTNSGGTTETGFAVSMNPGDNFKIAAALNPNTAYNITQKMVDGIDPLLDNVVLSPELLVWRKLWIERDSMAAVATSGPEQNFVEGTEATYSEYNTPKAGQTTVYLHRDLPDEFEDTDQFKTVHPSYGGWYIAGGDTYRVISSEDTWGSNDIVVVKDDATGAGSDFELYDEDDQGILPKYPSMGDWESVFHAAYIYPEELPSTYSSEVSFDRNLSSGGLFTGVSWGEGSWNEDYNCPSSSDFWTVLTVGAFQPETGADYDPDNEAPLGGAARVYGDDNQSVIYFETLRDVTNIVNEGQELAHEIGHGAGIEDKKCEEGCLMWIDDNNQLGDHFCEKCIKEMRKDSNY